MNTEGEDTNAAAMYVTADLHKSCDRCGLKKRKCDGGLPCGRCSRIGGTCTYSKRRPRPRPPGAVSVGSASDRRVQARSSLQARRAVSAALRHYGNASFKRCRLSPSPATGLVGMEENIFLSDYFGCVGFLPFTSQSNIRETLVKMFVGPISVKPSDSGDYSKTDQIIDTLMPADSELPVDPSTCVFWCAVALGALAKGRPIESVEKYSRLAREAVANVKGPPSAEVAKAWAILAYLHDFCGNHATKHQFLAMIAEEILCELSDRPICAWHDPIATMNMPAHQDNFHVFLQRANDTLCQLQEEGNEILPTGLSDVVKHGETIKLFIGDVNREEVETFCKEERAIPQMNEAATEAEICQFVMQSYRSFEQGVYENASQRLLVTHKLGGEGKPPTDMAWGEPAVADLFRGSNPHFIASLMPAPGEGSGSSGILGMMAMMLRTHSRQFERLEHAADWPNIRGGIGGLIINGTLVFGKIARKDFDGALEKLEKCAEVLERYPGLHRFTMGSHITHMLLTNLTVIDDPRARVIYGKLRAAYNSALFPGTPAIPPFEEWQGVSSCCNNYYCRLMELMVLIEYEDPLSSVPPQECVAETREMGPNDAPVDDQLQQTREASVTTYREGVGDNSVDVGRPRHKTVDDSGSNREGELVSDEESIGWVEGMSSDGQQTALPQPPDPTLTSLLSREGASEPVDLSEIDQIVADSFMELGAQAVEAVVPSGFSKSRTIIGRIEDENIDVEDWLDVTDAMLDTSGLGLDF